MMALNAALICFVGIDINVNPYALALPRTLKKSHIGDVDTRWDMFSIEKYRLFHFAELKQKLLTAFD